MIYNYLSTENDSDSWGVSKNDTGTVLVQLNQGTEQVRVSMTPSQAKEMADKISNTIRELSLEGALNLYSHFTKLPTEH